MADRPTRRRFYVETALGALTFLLLALTVVSAEWIEAVFGVDPDHGNGSAEWLVVGLLAAVTLAFAVAARAEYRRAVTT
jgi:hypothetical protein